MIQREKKSIYADNLVPFKISFMTMLTRCLVLSLPLTDTALTTKQRSRIGSPNFQHHLMSLNSGLLCKTFGFIWRLCLLGVTSLKTCHRYSQCLYLYVLKITSSFLAKTKKHLIFPNVGSKAISKHRQVLDYCHAARPKISKCGRVLCG